MPISSTFHPDNPSLKDILEDIHHGKYQLPDFQRGWVWDDNHIRDLIASVSKSYPVGAIMLLKSGVSNIMFKPRLIEGVDLHEAIEPDKLILDGQQRLTSLYFAFKSGRVVPTRSSKGQEIERVYYLDISKCLDIEIDRFEAILSIPPDRQIRSDFGRIIEIDLSSREKEFEKGYYPLEIIFDYSKSSEWRRGYERFFNYDSAKLEEFSEFEEQILQPFHDYRIPTIELSSDTNKEAVCIVFEKVNTSGVVLTIFELMTATYAAEDFSLRDDWEMRQERIQDQPQLWRVDATDFLTSVTLLSSYKRHQTQGSAVSCKRRDVLKLSLEEYKNNADKIEQGYKKAARFLAREKVFDAKDLPYQTQLIPLSAICAMLENSFEDDTIRRKLAHWYWCRVFGEMYGGANETRYALDIVDVLRWLNGGEEPRTMRDANFTPPRLLTLQTRLSAAYKGVMAQLMQVGSNDFINGDPIELTTYFDLNVDIHHIFPRNYCQQQNYNNQFWNSIINKAPLTYRTNRILGGNAPRVYLENIEQQHEITTERLNDTLQCHLIDPNLLRTNDFDSFIADRASKLLDRIEVAMSKPIMGRTSEEVSKLFGRPLITTQ